MRKLGPTLAIISGLIGIILWTLVLLVLNDVTEIKFVGEYNSDNNVSDAAAYGGLIASIISFLLGFFAYKKARGFASFILLIIFGIRFVFALMNMIDADEFPIFTVINVVILGLAAVFLLIGFIRGND